MLVKTIDLSKTVYELCSEDEGIAPILKELGFTDITKPGMLMTVGRTMTIPKGAMAIKIDLETIKQVFQNHGYQILS